MRGNGRIFKRTGLSFWWGSLYVRGKEVRFSTNIEHLDGTDASDDKKDKAERAARRFLEQKKDEKGADRMGLKTFAGPRQERLTINQLLDALERDLRLRGKWDGKVQSNLRPLREHFGAMRVVDLTTEAISAYIETCLAEGYSKATVNRRTQRLSQSFRLAMRQKQLNDAPFVPRLSEIGNERTGFFEPGDFNAVVDNLPEHLRDFARFGYITGWRKGAIASLEWTDIGDDVVYLRAQNSKTRKPETVPLEGELAEIIARRRAAMVLESATGDVRFAKHVFHRGGVTIGDFRKSWASACGKSGLTGRLFHDLRRTASRNMIAAGVPQVVAMKITGHLTDSVFRRYAIVDEEQKKQALASTAKYLATAAHRKIAVMPAQKASR